MHNIVTAMKRGIKMIVVDKWNVIIKDNENLLSTELALLLHIIREEKPEILVEAMEAEEKLYNMTKEGK